MSIKNNRILVTVCLLSIIIIMTPGCDDDLSKKKGCVELIAEIKANADRSTDKPLYIIFCDYTSSMDKQSFDYVTKNARKIFDFYYNKAILKFYPITSRSQAAFFESDMVVITDSGKVEQSDGYNFEQCIASIKPQLADSLTIASKQFENGRPKESYIVQSIEDGIRLLDTYDPGHSQKNKIFLLSDMLESGISSFGKINLEDQSFSEDIQQVQQTDTASILNRFTSNIELFIGFYSAKAKDKKVLSDFWRALFQKMGYSKKVNLNAEIIL